MSALDGIWWDSGEKLPSWRLVVKRNFEIGAEVRPWRFQDEAEAAAGLTDICQLPAHPLEIDEVLGGQPISSMARIQFDLAGRKWMAAGFPFSDDRRQIVVDDDLPAIVDRVRDDVRLAWGRSSDDQARLTPFKTDGCSLFLDGSVHDRYRWRECCVAHDIAYWKGGTRDDRRAADKALRGCVLDKGGSKALSVLMYDAVRAWGGPVFPTWYRWGYGWSYGRGYGELTEYEEQQVEVRLEEYQLSLEPPAAAAPGE